MTTLVNVVGITGWAALGVAVVGWIGKRAVDAKISRSQKHLESELRKTEQRLTASLTAAATVDVDLRSKRDATYREIWARGIILSKYPPNEELKYADLKALASELREWYFSQGGGLYMSEATQKAYVALHRALDATAQESDTKLVYGSDDYERLHESFSALRTEVTKDLQTRVRTLLEEVRATNP